jgi:hypothetical protein
LSGYPPKKEVEVTPSVTPNQTEKLKPTRPISQVSNPKLTPGHILEIVHGIFTEPAIRKEFFTYLKGLFATKKG